MPDSAVVVVKGLEAAARAAEVMAAEVMEAGLVVVVREGAALVVASMVVVETEVAVMDLARMVEDWGREPWRWV